MKNDKRKIMRGTGLVLSLVLILGIPAIATMGSILKKFILKAALGTTHGSDGYGIALDGKDLYYTGYHVNNPFDTFDPNIIKTKQRDNATSTILLKCFRCRK
jgi:hypothetical protein